MNNKPFTLEEINKLLDDIKKPVDIHMNQKMYDSMLPLLDYEPSNVVISNGIPDNLAIVVPDIRSDDSIRYRIV